MTSSKTSVAKKFSIQDKRPAHVKQGGTKSTSVDASVQHTLNSNPALYTTSNESGAFGIDARRLTPEGMLHLQRTIGNQATRPIISGLAAGNGFIQRDLAFTTTNWNKAKAVKDVSSGVNRVFIVDNLVLKALPGGGAQQQFASQLYGELVQAPKTRAVQVDSPEGQDIVAMLGEKQMSQLANKFNVLLVMEKVGLRSMEDFAEEIGNPGDRNDDWKNKLRKEKKEKKNPESFDSVINGIFDSKFFDDLGRIHAMDMFLGNADRMDRYGEVAMQNIFISVGKNGNYGSLGLDLDVEAASRGLVKASGKSTTGTNKNKDLKKYEALTANETEEWVLHSIKGADATRELQNVNDPNDKITKRFGTMAGQTGIMDSTDISALFDGARIDKAIEEFRKNLEKWFPKPPTDQPPTNERERRGDMIGTGYYSKFLWPLAKTKFAAGIETGIAAIMKGMEPGGKYADIYKESTQNNPKEETFDFMVLQIRTKYIELKKDTRIQRTEAEIMKSVVAYAERLLKGWGNI